MLVLKQISRLLLPCLVAPMLLGGCGQYPEGPDFSLRAKKARLVNYWEVQYVEDRQTGEDATEEFFINALHIRDDNTIFAAIQGAFGIEGEWHFISDKEAVEFRAQVEFGGQPFNFNRGYTILRLKHKELWLEDEEQEVHLEPR